MNCCARPCPEPQVKKTAVVLDLVAGGHSMTAVADGLGITRPYLLAMCNRPPPRRRGRPPLPDAELVGDIRLLITDLPTYGYRRVHVLLRRQAEKDGRKSPSVKRVQYVMEVHGFSLQRGGERREKRCHDGRMVVDQRRHPLVFRRIGDRVRRLREEPASAKARVRVTFALDCYDWEAIWKAMGHVATTGGITAEDVQDLMVATVEHRYGRVNRVPGPIEWLTDNGSFYTARDTCTIARGIGLVPRTIPVSSPQSNGMAEAFVRTLKRDYVRAKPRPDAQTVIAQLPAWLDHYNKVRPHRALGYGSPREFIATTHEALSAI